MILFDSFIAREEYNEEGECWGKARRVFRPRDVESGSESAAWVSGKSQSWLGNHFHLAYGSLAS